MNRQWVVGREGAIYHYLYFNPERKELAALTIYQPRTDKWILATETSAETRRLRPQLDRPARSNRRLHRLQARNGRVRASIRSRSNRRTTSRPNSPSRK